MAKYVLAGSILGLMFFGDIKIVIVPCFFFLLYVIDDLFGTVASFIVLTFGLLSAIGYACS